MEYNSYLMLEEEAAKLMLQIQLKDEQAANAELEKYEALSDFNLKEM